MIAPTLFLCGAGNPDGVRLALRINERAHRWGRVVLLDDNPATHGRRVLGIVVDGGLELLRGADNRRDETANLITRTTRRRLAARQRIAGFGLPPATLISPGVDTLGADTAGDVVVYSGTELGVGTRIGQGSALLVGATLGHEAVVGEGCILGPGAVLNARVRFEEGAYIGSNAVVLPDVTVGAWATIGAGAVVMEDLPAGATVAVSPPEVILERPPSTQAAPPAVAPVYHGDPTRLVTHAWLEVLNKNEVRRTENFFDAGGDSLSALRVLSRLRTLGGFQVSLVDFYRFPTIGSLAAHLGSRRVTT